MSTTKAKAGLGTLLQRGDGATPSETFTTIGQCRDFSGGGKTRNTDDATHQESTDGYAEVIPTLKDTEPLSFQLNWDPTDTGYLALDADFESGARRNFRLVLPNTGKRLEFAAFVLQLSPTYPMDGKMAMDVQIKLQGKPILVAHP